MRPRSYRVIPMLSVRHIQSNLTTRQLGREITYVPFTDSTNDDLLALVDAGRALPGQVVVTDDQRSGKGRHGRRWHCGPGLGLPFSMLLHIGLPAERLGLLALAAGVAVADVLSAHGVAARLKWPNDILVEDRKLGGILAESRMRGKEQLVVLGVGINVNEQLTDFPEELHPTAVSVHMALGEPVQRELILAHILNRLEQLLDGNFDEIVSLWLARCAHLGQPVRYHGPHGPVEGRFTGVDETGRGILEVAGSTRLVAAGDLDWNPA